MQLIKQDLFSSDSFAGRYLNEDKIISTFYDYSLGMEKERAAELANYSFQRDHLAEAMLSFQKKNYPCDTAIEQIELLRKKDAITVVGGQQAGLFTGPMYTIHKIISIISEAGRLKKMLNQPVIPVFWIAGEDHDIDEINHAYVFRGEEAKKIKIPENNQIKTPASERIIDPDAAKEVVFEAMRHLQETKETKALKQALLQDIDGDLTYISWFSKILYYLFKGTGLVVMDAHDPLIRQIEKPYFEKMIAQNKEVRKGFLDQALRFKGQELGEPVMIEPENAHLFFHEDNQRFLLHADEHGWKEKGKDTYWSQEEIMQKVEKGEIALSNNVITRPLMQDLLMPVHTFIAGAGELAYWGLLKNVFHSFGHRMPIVRPRHSITFVSRKSAKTMKQYNLSLASVLKQGTKALRKQRVANVKSTDEKDLFIKAEKKMKESLSVIAEALPSDDKYLQLKERFENKAAAMLKDYERSIEHVTEEIESVHLKRLHALDTELFPEEQKQERHYTILSYVNSEGTDLIQRLLREVKREENGVPSHFISYL